MSWVFMSAIGPMVIMRPGSGVPAYLPESKPAVADRNATPAPQSPESRNPCYFDPFELLKASDAFSIPPEPEVQVQSEPVTEYKVEAES